MLTMAISMVNCERSISKNKLILSYFLGSMDKKDCVKYNCWVCKESVNKRCAWRHDWQICISEINNDAALGQIIKSVTTELSILFSQ